MDLGYFYDELLAPVSAQKLIIGKNYKSQARNLVTYATFPVMQLHYLGALKAYLLVPFFYIFGDSLWVVRIFTISCGFVTLVLTYFFVGKFFSRQLALLVIILLVFDPSFIAASRYDFGPTAVQNILKMLILYLFYYVYYKGLSRFHVFLLGLVSGLIIWDKLIGIWIVFPVHMILLCRYWKSLQVNIHKVIIGFSGFLLGSLPVIYFFFSFPFFLLSRDKLLLDVGRNDKLVHIIFTDIHEKITIFMDTLNGIGVTRHIVPGQTSVGIFGYVFLFCIILIVISVHLFRQRLISEFRLMLLLFSLLLLFIFCTPHAVWAHHMLFLYPLPQIIVCYVLVHYLRLRTAVFTIFIICIINLLSFGSFITNVESKLQTYYWGGEDLVTLSDYLLRLNVSSITAVDWGISLPVAFVTHGQVAISDIEGIYTDRCTIIEKHVSAGMIIMYARNWESLSKYYKNCQTTIFNGEWNQTIVGPYLIIRR